MRGRRIRLGKLKPLKFDWDESNKHKNWEKHRVDFRECEQVFFNKPLLISFDEKHSAKEKRFRALGQTNKQRKSFISFTIRNKNKKIRIISARDQGRKERRIYTTQQRLYNLTIMSKKKKLKPIPRFKSEDEEREFWATHDSTDYIDWSKTVELDLSELRPSTKSVTIRLPESLLAALKNLAHKKDVPYQSLMKIFLAERVKKELRSA